MLASIHYYYEYYLFMETFENFSMTCGMIYNENTS